MPSNNAEIQVESFSSALGRCKVAYNLFEQRPKVVELAMDAAIQHITLKARKRRGKDSARVKRTEYYTKVLQYVTENTAEIRKILEALFASSYLTNVSVRRENQGGESMMIMTELTIYGLQSGLPVRLQCHEVERRITGRCQKFIYLEYRHPKQPPRMLSIFSKQVPEFGEDEWMDHLKKVNILAFRSLVLGNDTPCNKSLPPEHFLYFIAALCTNVAETPFKKQDYSSAEENDSFSDYSESDDEDDWGSGRGDCDRGVQ